MKRATRILVVFLCVSICAGGVLLSARGNGKESRPKTNIVPIDNRAPHHGVWIWA